MNFRKALSTIVTLLTLCSGAILVLAQSDPFHPADDAQRVPRRNNLKQIDLHTGSPEVQKSLFRRGHLTKYEHPENLRFANPPELTDLNKPETGAWVSLGPEGGWIGAMLMHPTDHNVLYAQTVDCYPTKFFKSTNGGATWTFLSSINDYIYATAIDPTNPAILYAAYGNYMYKSLDGGATWGRYEKDTNWSFTADIHVCPTNNNIVYAAGYYYTDRSYIVVYKSTDGGLNWSAIIVSPSSYQQGYAYSFAVDPVDPNILYLGGDCYDGYSWKGLLFKSTDGGANWMNIYNNIVGYVYALAIDPTAPNKVYVGTYDGVYRSANGGSSWQKNSGYAYAFELAIDPKNPKIIYAGTYKNIFKSTDGGINWTNYQTGLLGECKCLLVDHTNANNVFYGSNVGVFKSTNNGVAWSAANTGLLTSTITAMAVAPSAPKTLYIEFDGNAIFKTTDSGNNWTRLNEFLACGNIGAIAVPPTSASIAYALEGSG
jgi:photosystem II stability/assembly factor-like uncharacterized protein